ncbi:tyrosine-type recombinase/integrase [Nonomuraea sp. B12E4]|uniref:tyrosine-type recombinase/integrase n=1 Tax=Nonomuraea sp. B12E4 TaxID=3153564 RepID=UPI00325C4180
METSYNVRIWKTDIYKGAKVTTYTVRWRVGEKPFKEPFRGKTQADNFKAELTVAANRGEAFSVEDGRPISWRRDEQALSWFTFTCAYTDTKWPYASGNHRKSIAEALTDATEALLMSDAGRPDQKELRAALRGWVFSTRVRDGAEPAKGQHTAVRWLDPPEDIQHVVRWLQENTIDVRELTRPKRGPLLTRAVLDRISRKQDGTAAAGNTVKRKRQVLNNAFKFAREISALQANPLDSVTWTKPRTDEAVDPGVVANREQARAILAEVAKEGAMGKRLAAFFGCMYYAALRPEEVIDLRTENIKNLPESGEWGEFVLTNSDPEVGTKWTDDGKARQRRGLKHRPVKAKRQVPIHPDLVALLHAHRAEFNHGREGRIFTGPRGGIIRDSTYLPVWHKARERALSPAEQASGIAARPYDFRHACVSTWLNAGVNPPQVAEWAGHSVDVLLRVYAKCIAGGQVEAMRRIETALPPAAPAERPDAPKAD